MRYRKISYSDSIIYKFMAKIDKYRRRLLRKRFHFEEWHDISLMRKEYAIDMIHFLNALFHVDKEEGYAVEVGCGIGDIIGNLKNENKIGVDRSSEALNCLRYKYPSTMCVVGTFDEVELLDEGMIIDVLIAVNFIHNIPPHELKKYIDHIVNKHYVRYIVIDVVKGEGYKYYHNADDLLSNNFYRIVRSKPYKAANGATRWIEYWKNKTDVKSKEITLSQYPSAHL